uniref:Reverse transcriptase domain-containing protein n=1 Tax=Bursaphelenchus xylophilus TaxID=6326 RepID=A0A1I7SGZ5_BURXY
MEYEMPRNYRCEVPKAIKKVFSFEEMQSCMKPEVEQNVEELAPEVVAICESSFRIWKVVSTAN